jgi:hypothetical protein
MRKCWRDEEILCSEQAWESDGSNDEIQLFNEKDEYELVRTVEEGMVTLRSDNWVEAIISW